jgi:glycosyltransferase involved in cell wall biosynthesis
VLSYATDRNSWLAEPTTAGLAAAVCAAVAQPDARIERRARALADASSLDWQRVAPRWFAMYEEIHRARLAREQAGVAEC